MKRMPKDNRGIALVSVMITIMLCFLLSATILRVSYLALLSRSVNRVSADTFYDAESVIDDFRVELQTATAAVIATVGKENSAAFIDSLYAMVTAGTDADPLKNIETFLTKNLAVGAGNVKVSVEGITKTSTEMIITGVSVEYTDPGTQYVSSVKTDIRVNAPVYASKEEVSLGSYSMLVGSGATFTSSNYQIGWGKGNKVGYFIQDGNVYIGLQGGSGTVAADLLNGIAVIFNGDNVVINGDIKVTGKSTLAFTGKKVEVRGKIILDTGYLLLGPRTELVCKDIVIDGKSMASESSSIDGLRENNGTQYSIYFPYGVNPVKDANGNASEWTDYDDKNDGAVIKDLKNMSSRVFVQDGSGSAYHMLSMIPDEYSYYIGGTKYNYAGTIYFDPVIAPEPRVTHTDKWGKVASYDAKFASLINLDTLTAWDRLGGGNRFNSPSQKLVNATLIEKQGPDASGIFKGSYFDTASGITSSQIVSGSAPSTFKYRNSAGTLKDYGVRMEIVRLEGDVNAGDTSTLYLCFGITDYKVSMNWGTDYVGIFLSAEKVVFSQQEGASRGVSILDSRPEYAAENKEYLKAFMDDLGMFFVVKENLPKDCGTLCGSEEFKYAYAQLINNFFVGGTKSFYETSTGESGGSVDTTVNSTVDIIELENWNKK